MRFFVDDHAVVGHRGVAFGGATPVVLGAGLLTTLDDRQIEERERAKRATPLGK